MDTIQFPIVSTHARTCNKEYIYVTLARIT